MSENVGISKVDVPVAAVAKQHSTFGNESEEEAEGRDRWPSRAAFYLAAVGSAVGFGNVWRFPALAKDYGGGAFFIPYIMALLIVGIPVLILEISLGQAHQVGNVGVFGSFHPRIRGVGCASAACAFMLVVYYSILLAWVANGTSNTSKWVQEVLHSLMIRVSLTLPSFLLYMQLSLIPFLTIFGQRKGRCVTAECYSSPRLLFPGLLTFHASLLL